MSTESVKPVKPTTSLVVGQHLFTRDGRIVGNAIVTEVTPDGLIRMETDFGNGGSLLNTNEVAAWWHTTHTDGTVRISDLARWRADRARLTRALQNTDDNPPQSPPSSHPK